ncbi:Lrp/AsnC family transcriptional regulator [Arthrobacter caoxuetaonis]|uniref:Lrp/AsnC family transcriptional regulator n=1 Tax=Arthrobacter caoxuetaonis TaxID=2886935 RepID=UPI001D15B8CF|nr:Lrp/AsnC family transcriptional regulator [Arthrobacter caoxuetaonis]MCC3283366.1 Lrp/AsnC family transcriptional regulator [Arthrobacter caoxuetaonis]
MKLDNIDRHIITALKADGRRSYTSIAAELELSEGTIRYRAQRLMADGVMQVVAVTDPIRVGRSHFFMVDVATKPGSAAEVAGEVAKLPDVVWVALVDNGPFKLRVEIICRDMRHFRDVLFTGIEPIDGVLETRSQSILKVVKTNYGWGLPDQEDESA